MARRTSLLPEDGIYRAILLVLVGSVLIGAVVALSGEYIWHNEAASTAGTWLTLVSGVVYLFFRWLGLREMRRRRRQNDASGSQPDDERE